MSDALVTVESVSKKFCKTLNRSMFYGMRDIGRTMLGLPSKTHEIRTGEFWAVDNLSFELRRGECLGLIGPNGSGKSTLLKVINGIFSPDKGRVEIEGRVGAIIELGAGFHPTLTGRENIYVNASILGFNKRETNRRFDSIVDFAELSDFIDTPVKHYSSGMRVRLGFAIAAQMEPDVLLIDEVLAVGDIGFKIKCLNRISKLIQNSAVIFVSHSMQFISRICTGVIVLDSGKAEYYEKDVAAGIDYYISKFERVERKISGSGKAMVSDVQLSSGGLGARGNEVLLLDYGADLSIQINLTLDPLVSQPAIRVIIYNQEMREVADCFSHFCGFEINPKRFTRIELKLRNLQFNMDIYSITIVVLDLSNNEILSRNDYVAYFQVKRGYSSWSSFLLRGEWKEEEF